MDMNEAHNAELRKLLLESCGIMAGYTQNCRNDFVAHNSSQTRSENTTCCDWYHSVWQYLRVLDCVSSPQWHYDFYKNAFEKVFNKKSAVRILISGTADYSLLYLIISLLADKKNCNAQIDIVDLCPTPLEICKWLWDKLKNSCKNIAVRTIISNITMYSSDYKYDIICADAFLTRFSSHESKSVVAKWEEMLDDGGRIITTVRLNDLAKKNVKPHVIDISDDINTFCSKVTKAYDGLSSEDKRKMNISAEDLRFMAFRYIIRMRSNVLGEQDKISELFGSMGLRINDDESKIHAVKGEIRETMYYGVVAQKSTKKLSGGRK